MKSVKVKKAIPKNDLILEVEFDNGIKKKYDVKQLFNQFPEYKALEHRPLFNGVYVDCGGCSVAWTPDIDVSEWELWDNGVSL